MQVHESIARAQFRGLKRKAMHRLDELQEKKNKIKTLKNRHLINSKQGVEDSIRHIMELLGDNVFNTNFIHRRSSWHYKQETCFFEAKAMEVEGIGPIRSLNISRFDTRKMLKRKPAGISHLMSRFFVHDHMIMRCIQRLGFESFGQVGEALTPLMHWMVTQNLPLATLPRRFYLVTKNFVLVFTYMDIAEHYLIKTVLLWEMMEDNQSLLFDNCRAVLDFGGTSGLITDMQGNIEREIPVAKAEPLFEKVGLDSHWFELADRNEMIKNYEQRNNEHV